MPASKKLYYVYDPMCSWCWGYKPVWETIRKTVSANDEVDVVYVLGGLAPDTDQPMPEAMQQQIASYWKKIENYLGTEFNYDFWALNTPRRATYPSCRAIIAARQQGAELEMLAAIQSAYYLNAKNPSDNDVLIDLAGGIGLDTEKFKAALTSDETQHKLELELQFARSIGGNSFPSLFVEAKGRITELPVNYQDANETIERVRSI